MLVSSTENFKTRKNFKKYSKYNKIVIKEDISRNSYFAIS